MKRLTLIDPTHPVFKPKKDFFDKQICDKEKRFVWCCRNGETATEAELIKLNGEYEDTKTDTTTTTSNH